MTSDLCFECDNQGVTLFYPRVESLIMATKFGAFIPFGDLSTGGWFQRACPYCVDASAKEDGSIHWLTRGGGMMAGFGRLKREMEHV